MATVRKSVSRIRKQAGMATRVVLGLMLIAAVLLWLTQVVWGTILLMVSSGVVAYYRPILSGASGEHKVVASLSRLPDAYHVFHDLDLPTEADGTTQLDHLDSCKQCPLQKRGDSDARGQGNKGTDPHTVRLSHRGKALRR